MQIELQQARERVTVLAPKGRLDMSTAPLFRERVRELVASGAAHLVVDLEDVTFVDSSGLGAVIGGLKAARQAGGDLRIARPNQQVLLVLDLTSLNRVLRPYGSLEEALAGL
ncbi:MAG TPA: STAS domain-containing protein [Candidatus Dormibacteraeota bacterium]|nr:STAS domain-containing protein [Candidatus Dormibacteraeota bacterium]